MSYLTGSRSEVSRGTLEQETIHSYGAWEGQIGIPSVTWARPAGPTFRPSSLRRFLGDGVLCGAEQNADLPDDGDSEANRLRSTVRTLAGIVAFYENCTRVVLLKTEKVQADGHVGEDTIFYCVVPYTANGEPQVFYFTLEVYSQYGSLGIEHLVRYKPGLVDEMDELFASQLGRFKDEFTIVADDIQLLFARLTQRIDSIIGQEFSELIPRI